MGAIVSSHCRAQEVRSEGGGLAVGGNITGSQISIGISADKLPGIIEAATKDWRLLSDQQKSTIHDLKKRLGVNEAALRAFFITIGASEVPVDQLEQKLLEIAGNYKGLLDKVKPEPDDDQKITEIKNAVRDSLEAGRLDRADELLDQLQNLQDAGLEERELERAGTAAQRGELAMAQLRYRDAARYFADAVDRVPTKRTDIRLGYLDQEAGALYAQGDERGDNKALAMAVERYRDILSIRRRDSAPLDWAATENNLGAALERLGEREGTNSHLEAAITAYRAALAAASTFYAALEEDTGDRLSWLAWAMIQMNLGAALQTLGERERGIARLEEALAAYRGALGEYTAERAPLKWSMTQMDLGNVLETLGELKSDTKLFEQAVNHFKAALERCEQGQAPLLWSMIEMDLGNVLQTLGRRTNDTKLIEQALTHYIDALAKCTQSRAPLMWAMIQNNLGMARKALGESQRDPTLLLDAVASYKAALKVYKPDNLPVQWAQAEMNMANALQTLGHLQGSAAHLEAAVAAYHAILDSNPSPIEQANTRFNLGIALVGLGTPQQALGCFQKSQAAFLSIGMIQGALAASSHIASLQDKVNMSLPDSCP